MTLSALLNPHPGPASSAECEWRLAACDREPAAVLDGAAWIVADHIMQTRTNGSAAYALWLTKATTSPGITLSDRDRDVVDAFIRPAFGLPEHPRPDDHLQGYIAEALWHLLTLEFTDETRTLRNIDPPSWTTTEPGGDGLAVYEVAPGVLVFRLWEIKKTTGRSHVSATIRKASSQLSSNGIEYLAKCTAYGSRSEDAEIAALYAQLPELWRDDDQRAGIGVAIATSRVKAPTRRSFGALRRAFPSMAAAQRLEGLIVALGDYSDFCERVREIAWSGR
jgi:hypothetical protein